MKLLAILICSLLSVSVLAGTTKPIKVYVNCTSKNGSIIARELRRGSAVIGKTSYYTIKSCIREGTSGTTMANNKPYVESAMTCALPFHPPIKANRRQWGKEYKVTNLGTGQTVLVSHQDYGPGTKALADGVVIDLTPAAFKKLCPLRLGHVKVIVEQINEREK